MIVIFVIFVIIVISAPRPNLQMRLLLATRVCWW
jgi:hypothetical protein